MGLGHPLEHQDEQRDAERLVTKHHLGHRLWRADDLAFGTEPVAESLTETLKQLDMLGFLAGEVEHRADPQIIGVRKVGADMVEHEWQDEFLDQAEQAEILMR